MLGIGRKDYNSIVAPLKTIESDLSTYIGNQETEVSTLEDQKKNIDTQIGNSKLEIRKSEHTVEQIGALLAVDFDVEPAEVKDEE